MGKERNKFRAFVEQRYREKTFRELMEKTREYPWGKIKNEPKGASEKELWKFRVRELVNWVNKRAIRTYYQTSEDIQRDRTIDDWIQDARVIFLQQGDEYDPKNVEDMPFNYFMMFRVKNRLISIQEKLSRENPYEDDEVWKVIAVLRREDGKEPSVEKISKRTGRSQDEIKKILATGYGPRILVRETEEEDTDGKPRHYRAEPRIGQTPEDYYMRKEAWNIIEDCLNQLGPYLRQILWRCDIEGISCAELARRTFRDKSARSLTRHLKEKARVEFSRCIYEKTGEIIVLPGDIRYGKKKKV